MNKTRWTRESLAAEEKPALTFVSGISTLIPRMVMTVELADKGPIIRGDIPNFTNATPIRQISEILE